MTPRNKSVVAPASIVIAVLLSVCFLIVNVVAWLPPADSRVDYMEAVRFAPVVSVTAFAAYLFAMFFVLGGRIRRSHFEV